MPGQINNFGDLAVVRASADAEGWIINSGHRSGLFGPDRAFFWQWLKDGTLRLGDPTTRTFSFSQKIGLEKPENVNVFAGKDCLWIVPEDAAQGAAVCFDLPTASIRARVPDVRHRQYKLGRVASDGGLIVQGTRRIDDRLYEELTKVDPVSFEVSTSRVIIPKVVDTTEFVDFFASSPCGTYWLRLDHTHFPVVERREPGDAGPRRYYGLTVQIWSAFPLRFERRVVVAWLKAEDLPDETHILDVRLLAAAKERLNAQKREPVAPPTSGLVGRLFGRKGTSAPAADPDAVHLAALAQSAPARDRIYTAISQALHRPGADPEADFPRREAFGIVTTDDDLWQAVNKNIAELFRHALGTVVGWDAEDAIWLDRLGHLICVGMDGTVSPQLWFERAGLQHMMKPFPKLPGALEVVPGRKLRAVRLPNGTPSHVAQFPDEAGGCLIVDGAPVEPRYAPLRIARQADGWEGPQSIPVHWLNEATDYKDVDQYRRTRSTITIPLVSLDPAGRTAAIDAYRDLLDHSFFERATDSSIKVRFKFGKATMSERQFFMDIKPDDREWAFAPLHALVARYAELKGPTLDTTYQADPEDGSLLAQAVHRLGEMDARSLAVLVAYGEGIDGGHEYYFAGDTLPAVVAAHGWTDDVIGFVAWAHAFNYYNTYDVPTTIWQTIGLGKALKQRPAEAASEFLYAQLAPFVAAGRLQWTNFECLRDRLGADMDAWEQDFFNQLTSLVEGDR